MSRKYPAFKVAAAHVAPVFLDTDRTVAKACALIREAAENGAQLVVFPEAFIPGFPVWAGLAAPIRTHELFKALAASAIEIDGPEIASLCEQARQSGVLVSIGFDEGTKVSVGCIWNANVLIGEDGRILNHHRKLVPTFYEKLVWANGDGSGLAVSETPIGRVGMLICGENTNPLARYTLMAQGEQVHISSWPPLALSRPPDEAGAYDLEQAIRIRVGAHSFEGKVFSVASAGYVDATMRERIETVLGSEALKIVDSAPRPISMVVGPNGMPMCEAPSTAEGILYADIDIAQCVEPKQLQDVVGYYNRFDIFNLTVDRSANRPITFSNASASNEPAKLPGSAPAPEDTRGAPPLRRLRR